MAENEAPPAESGTPTEPDKPAEQTVPYERFQQANTKAKEFKDRATKLEKDMADLRARMEERENQGLPELERMRKDMERIQKRAEEAEAAKAEADTKLARTTKERWVTAAAQAQGFQDPSDAAAFLALDDLEDERDAERAVKQLAKQKKHLLKVEGPQLPGRVLQNGQTPQAVVPKGSIDLSAEAQMVADNLKAFLKNRQ